MSAPTDRCRCGHYRREHTRPIYTSSHGNLTFCSGNTWAYPDDAERDSDGVEVRCLCDHFDLASEAEGDPA